MMFLTLGSNNSWSTLVTTTPVNSKSSNSSHEEKLAIDNQSFSDIFGTLYRVDDNSALSKDIIEEEGASVWVVFQNDCKACHKMMTESKCLKSKEKTKNYFVGILSRPEKISKSIKNYITLDKVLYSKADLVEKLKIDVTPTVYIFKNSKLVRRIDNYVSCREIKKLI